MAAFIILRWLATKEFPSNLLPDGPDRAFVQDVVYTVLRRLRALRKALGLFVAKWPKGEMEALLYVGAAQILYMPSIPPYAAVFETVEAAKACPSASVARVVNGVLRSLLRKKEEVLAQIATWPLEERESFPTALVKRWIERFGEENARRLVELYNSPAENTIVRRSGAFETLAHGKRVEDVAGYEQGEFIIQDPAASLATDLLDAQKGEKVLDYCAAPGGKTVRLAWKEAAVTAWETNARRRRRLVANLERCRLGDKVQVLQDAPPAGALYDKVLADVPCSNTGVLRRKPDARWNWSPEKMAALANLQGEILKEASSHVRPGGFLVYSTCSIEDDENGCVVRAFIEQNKAWTLVEERSSLPFETSNDGSYAALLKFNNETKE